jgi:hypothetical protein
MTASDKDVASVVTDIVTTDIGGRSIVGTLAEALDGEIGQNPAYCSAVELQGTVSPGDTVLVLTGFPIPPTMIQETDGPLGAVSIARAVDRCLDANPVIACEPDAVDICRATATAGGLSVCPLKMSLRSEKTVAVESFPTEETAAETHVDRMLGTLDPAAVVAVEKVGPNAAGVYHNMAGYDISDASAAIEPLYDALSDTLTVAIGDAGNEVGLGLIEETVRESVRNGAECQCPCGEGIAAAISNDIVVPATVSNWGGHAIAACLSDLTGMSALHEPDVEQQMLDAASAAGAIDGIGGGTNAWCDGMPPTVHESIVHLLREALRSSVYTRGAGELGR